MKLWRWEDIYIYKVLSVKAVIQLAAVKLEKVKIFLHIPWLIHSHSTKF